MKMKLEEIRTRHRELMGMADRKLPNRLAYAVAKNIAKLQEEAELIEKRRIAIAETHAGKDENGRPVIKNGMYEMDASAKQEFNREFMEFLGEETEVQIQTVPESVFDLMEDPRYDVLSPAEILAFGFMVDGCTGTESK